MSFLAAVSDKEENLEKKQLELLYRNERCVFAHAAPNTQSRYDHPLSAPAPPTLCTEHFADAEGERTPSFGTLGFHLYALSCQGNLRISVTCY